MYEMMAPELFRSLQKKMECIDGFIYTARKNLKPFSDEFIAKKNFKRIDNAVTATSYVPVDRCELGIGRDDFVLCMIARGRPDKGWHEAIDSVLMANEMSIRPIQLLLIGDGDEPERLKPLYANQERIHFLGFQGQIRSFLACSDIGFIPSRFPGESFPLVLIDSLMCGKPVLASAIGEIEPMLTTCDGLAGIVFPLEDWQIPIRKLADIIVELANDRESYQALLDRVEIAANKFNPINMAEQYEIAYESM
jgi:glycosyltransferase involved in cell wall biosynthesis